MPEYSTIKIKRRRVGSAGAPSSLKNGELAFNEINDVLYYGSGENGAGDATNIIPIGGREYYTISYDINTPESLVGGEDVNYFTVPFNLNVVAWTLLATVTGSVLLDIQTCDYDNYPNMVSICNGNKPFITNDIKNRDLDVLDWEEYLQKDNILIIKALSAENIDRVTVLLKCERV